MNEIIASVIAWFIPGIMILLGAVGVYYQYRYWKKYHKLCGWKGVYETITKKEKIED